MEREMRITLPFGKQNTVILDVPNKNLCFVVDRGEIPALEDPQGDIRKASKNPIGAPPLSESVRPEDKVVIIGDDVTRPTPQSVIIPVLLDELNAIGVPDKNIEVIIALGTHREMSEKEIREKYGDEVTERVSVTNHDFKDPKKLVCVGKRQSGVPAFINKRVYDADFVIGVGNIVPHCYAGWGGGSKIIQPGVCGEEITGMTHVMAGKIRPITNIVGRLDNKIKDEMDAVALKAGLKLIVNTVLNQKDEISRVVVGDPIKAFREGVKIAERIYCPEVNEQADIVIVSSYPANIDYWQAIKPVDYASVAVKQGGTIILVAPCPDGVSPTHPTMSEKATLSYNELLKVIENKEIDDLVGGGALLMHAQILERAEVICYSDGLTEGDKEALGFKHASTIDEAIEMAFESHGRDAKIGVLKCGEILPVIKASQV